MNRKKILTNGISITNRTGNKQRRIWSRHLEIISTRSENKQTNINKHERTNKHEQTGFGGESDYSGYFCQGLTTLSVEVLALSRNGTGKTNKHEHTHTNMNHQHKQTWTQSNKQTITDLLPDPKFDSVVAICYSITEDFEIENERENYINKFGVIFVGKFKIIQANKHE